jgi:hypothetical protein
MHERLIGDIADPVPHFKRQTPSSGPRGANMERLGKALEGFLRFDLQADGWPSYAVFVVASGAIGLAIVLLDACSVALGRDSYLDLTHGPRATPKAALVWVIGSMLGSSLGFSREYLSQHLSRRFSRL